MYQRGRIRRARRQRIALLLRNRTGRISALNRPGRLRFRALRWLLKANSSCAARADVVFGGGHARRRSPCGTARTSTTGRHDHRSTSCALPMRSPSRAPGSRCGRCSSTPCRRRRRSRCRRRDGLLREHHCLQARPAHLVDRQRRDVVGGLRAARLTRGAWPTPAETTLPMMHSSTLAGSIPAVEQPRARPAHRAQGLTVGFREPRNPAGGVRTAETITASCMKPS